MMYCTKYNTCLNYKIRCADCKANSDIYNYYPLYKDRDLVEVVRCKNCKRCEVLYPEKKIGEEPRREFYCYFVKDIVKPDDFCSYGERREGE